MMTKEHPNPLTLDQQRNLLPLLPLQSVFLGLNPPRRVLVQAAEVRGSTRHGNEGKPSKIAADNTDSTSVASTSTTMVVILQTAARCQIL